MAFTGVGSTMLGPFLPHLSEQWRLHDHQAGILVSCLFLGSFSGTMLLSRHLDGCLRQGAWSAGLGCLLFGWFAHLASGFVGGAAALAIMGFGMGQLMSSINLLVGAAPAAERPRELANLGIAWCVGAILSPCLTTVLFSEFSPPLRVSFFAPLYLLPLLATSRYKLPEPPEREQRDAGGGANISMSRLAILCITIFLIYGGIESSIGEWMPLFAARYSGSTLAATQWLVSLFWLGLIAGRVLMVQVVSSATEPWILRGAISSSACCLLWLVLFPSLPGLMVGSAVMGICLSPIFPLMLSATIACGFTPRVMGIVLAACALGAAMFPLLLGLLSSMSSLRIGMLLPLSGLLLLLLLRWHPPEYPDPILMPGFFDEGN
jgi:FHS family glucose/mannose:H+ symporter-like MFS transporter